MSSSSSPVKVKRKSQFDRVINNEANFPGTRRLRNSVQITVAIFNIWLGWRLYLFYRYYRYGIGQLVDRPPGVEGYLPISALLSLKYWILTGVYDTVHPAGLAIFTAVILSALVLKRGFCSWLCPVGTLSEGMWRLGAGLFGRNFRLHRYLDRPLRALKYVLLSFFIYITATMSAAAIRIFLDSSYNHLADIKMLYFFMNLSLATTIFISFLVLASIFVKNFWCRYLCPYGALLGILSIAGLVTIARDATKCTSCHTCDKVCPANITVSAKKKIISPECTACMACVANCQSRQALSVSAAGRRITPAIYGSILVGSLLIALAAAQLSGHWKSSVRAKEYQAMIVRLESSALSHP